MALRGSFFGKILGMTTPAQDVAAAEKLVGENRYLEARALYERAASNEDDAESKTRWLEQAQSLRDRAAEVMLEHAEKFRADGQMEAARIEMRNAAEIAHSDAIKVRAERALEASENKAAARVGATETLSDDQRWAVLVGAWTEKALDESDRYGDAFRDAVLQMHDGELSAAREKFSALLLQHRDDAVYLWLEAGRCAVRAEDYEFGREALTTFIERVDDEPSAAQVDAYVALAELQAKNEDVAAGIDTLSAAVEKMPEHPLPLVALGSYLRRHDFAEEAISVLASAEALMDETQPDWVVLTEYGLALKLNGDAKTAREKLEQAFAVFTSRRILDVPPMLGLTLAEVHEELESHTRAADLFRLLAQGSDTANRAMYLRSAARNLRKIGLDDEARRTEARAKNLEQPAAANEKATENQESV